MQLRFTALADDGGNGRWKTLFDRLWPAYRAWYLREGHLARPTYLECRDALRTHMPAMVPVWEQLVGLAGGGDVAARFLSLYCPPQYLSGCSQAVWPGREPLLVRNYDYDPNAFEAVVLRTAWGKRAVLGTSDCLVGLVDGINDAGLALSLTFGGRRVVGPGFGMPILLRHVLQTCATTPEAVRVLSALPTHMAYNVTIVDERRRVKTLQLSPDRPPIVLDAAVATNHQESVEWHSHARETATLEREQFLLARLLLQHDPAEEFIGAFLRPPLYSIHFDRGFGTLYTAALWPERRAMAYAWPGATWQLSLTDFREDSRLIEYAGAAGR
ncbi:MAG: C45 family peptidase [Gammaproteobacteria bacterium]